MDASAGDVKKQVGNTLKALNGQYRFQTMGEYRALLFLYNLTVEARGNVRGRGISRAGLFRHGRQGATRWATRSSPLSRVVRRLEAVQKKFDRSKSEG